MEWRRPFGRRHPHSQRFGQPGRRIANSAGGNSLHRDIPDLMDN